MDFVQVGDEGPRALVVHGNDLCGAHYHTLAEALARRGVRSDLVTLPGFHRVPAPPEASWSGLVDALEGACAERDVSALIGHSMGGLVALLLAARRPSWLRALVLLEPAIFPNRAVAAIASRRYLRKIVDAPRAAPFLNSNGGQRRIAELARYPAELLALHDEVRATSDRAFARALFSTQASLYPLPLHEVTAPVLLVRGARSGWLSCWQTASLARALACETRVIAEAAHWLVGEVDEEVADVAAPFMRAHAAGERTTGATRRGSCSS